MQVSVVLGPRRRIREGENFTVPLEVVEGDDWDGLISGVSGRPSDACILHARRKLAVIGHRTAPLNLTLRLLPSASSLFVWACLETCEAPVSTFEKGKYCSPRTHAVDDACGPGLWGSCKYDESGQMGCLTHVCNGQGVYARVRARLKAVLVGTTLQC